jgi:hypothetical protein
MNMDKIEQGKRYKKQKFLKLLISINESNEEVMSGNEMILVESRVGIVLIYFIYIRKSGDKILKIFK